MARTKTRAERIDEKVKGGMSRVKAEIEVRRDEMLAKLDALAEEWIAKLEAKLAEPSEPDKPAPETPAT